MPGRLPVFLACARHPGVWCVPVLPVAQPTSRVTQHARREVVRADRRWLALTLLVFVVAMAVFVGGLALYRMTGPHPAVTLLLRQLRGWAKWVIPRHRRVRWGWW